MIIPSDIAARLNEFSVNQPRIPKGMPGGGRWSKGHVGFLGRWEYMKLPNGDLYRAPRDAPLDVNTGYRVGARFEAPAHMADQWVSDQGVGSELWRDLRYMKATIPETAFDFHSQVPQYPKTGPPGISYFKGDMGDGQWVDALLYRDDKGKLLGILNHYPFDFPPYEKKGNVNVMVDPANQGKGIGTALLGEALTRFNVDLFKQEYTASGLATARKLVGGPRGHVEGPEPFDPMAGMEKMPKRPTFTVESPTGNKEVGVGDWVYLAHESYGGENPQVDYVPKLVVSFGNKFATLADRRGKHRIEFHRIQGAVAPDEHEHWFDEVAKQHLKEGGFDPGQLRVPKGMPGAGRWMMSFASAERRNLRTRLSDEDHKRLMALYRIRHGYPDVEDILLFDRSKRVAKKIAEANFNPSQRRAEKGTVGGGRWSKGGDRSEVRKGENPPNALSVKKKLKKLQIYTTPGIEGLAKDTSDYLASISLPIPAFRVSMADAASQERLDRRGLYFESYTGNVIAGAKYFAIIDRLASDRKLKTPEDVGMVRCLLHEALHNVMGNPTFDSDYASFDRGRNLEEGLVESITADLGQDYIGKMYGRAARSMTGKDAIAPIYRDKVIEVRKRSARATGKKWNTPEAFAWRVSMLKKTFPEREKEWNRWGETPVTESDLSPAPLSRKLSESVSERIVRYGIGVLIHRAPDGTFADGGGGPPAEKSDNLPAVRATGIAKRLTGIGGERPDGEENTLPESADARSLRDAARKLMLDDAAAMRRMTQGTTVQKGGSKTRVERGDEEAQDEVERDARRRRNRRRARINQLIGSEQLKPGGPVTSGRKLHAQSAQLGMIRPGKDVKDLTPDERTELDKLLAAEKDDQQRMARRGQLTDVDIRRKEAIEDLGKVAEHMDAKALFDDKWGETITRNKRRATEDSFIPKRPEEGGTIAALKDAVFRRDKAFFDIPSSGGGRLIDDINNDYITLANNLSLEAPSPEQIVGPDPGTPAWEKRWTSYRRRWTRYLDAREEWEASGQKGDGPNPPNPPTDIKPVNQDWMQPRYWGEVDDVDAMHDWINFGDASPTSKITAKERQERDKLVAERIALRAENPTAPARDDIFAALERFFRGQNEASDVSEIDLRTTERWKEGRDRIIKVFGQSVKIDPKDLAGIELNVGLPWAERGRSTLQKHLRNELRATPPSEIGAGEGRGDDPLEAVIKGTRSAVVKARSKALDEVYSLPGSRMNSRKAIAGKEIKRVTKEIEGLLNAMGDRHTGGNKAFKPARRGSTLPTDLPVSRMGGPKAARPQEMIGAGSKSTKKMPTRYQGPGGVKMLRVEDAKGNVSWHIAIPIETRNSTGRKVKGERAGAVVGHGPNPPEPPEGKTWNMSGELVDTKAPSATKAAPSHQWGNRDADLGTMPTRAPSKDAEKDRELEAEIAKIDSTLALGRKRDKNGKLRKITDKGMDALRAQRQRLSDERAAVLERRRERRRGAGDSTLYLPESAFVAAARDRMTELLALVDRMQIRIVDTNKPLHPEQRLAAHIAINEYLTEIDEIADRALSLGSSPEKLKEYAKESKRQARIKRKRDEGRAAARARRLTAEGDSAKGDGGK